MIGKTIFALLFSTLLLAAVQQTQPDPKAILPAAAASTPQTATTIPRGGSVTPDGTLAEAEWADALREKLTGGAEPSAQRGCGISLRRLARRRARLAAALRVGWQGRARIARFGFARHGHVQQKRRQRVEARTGLRVGIARRESR